MKYLADYTWSHYYNSCLKITLLENYTWWAAMSPQSCERPSFIERQYYQLYATVFYSVSIRFFTCNVYCLSSISRAVSILHHWMCYLYFTLQQYVFQVVWSQIWLIANVIRCIVLDHIVRLKRYFTKEVKFCDYLFSLMSF